MNHDEFDQLLREAYEPRPGAAQRLARHALDESGVAPRRSPRSHSWLRPALLAAAVLALIAVSWRAIPHLAAPAAERVADRPAAGAPANPDSDSVPVSPDSHPPAPGAAARLSISNLDGPVTVTTADGTRWIALSPSTPSTTSGDPVS